MSSGAGETTRSTKFEGRARRGAIWVALLALAACLLPGRAAAQATPSFAAPAAYNLQPGTIPVGVATGVFNSSGGLLDFAVLEQVPNSGSYQVEVFHGKTDGSFCSNCTNANPNPDVIPLGSGVVGNAIAVGQFRATGPDLAVATNTGIVFLQNNGAGTFTLSTLNTISVANGFVALTVGKFDSSGNDDIAAVTPTVAGSVSFTVYLGNGTGAFAASTPYAINGTYNQCPQIMTGSFQGQTSGADLALLCTNPSFASVLVYLNSGTGSFTAPGNSDTLNAGNSLTSPPSLALGTLNGQSTVFIASTGNSLLSYESNGLAGANNAFTSVSMNPINSTPQGSIVVLYNTPTGAVDFATNNSGIGVSTFTSYTQSATSVAGTWNATGKLGPSGILATGLSSNLTRGATYVIVDAGAHTGYYSNPNVTGPPNFKSYADQRSVSVYLVTLNTSTDGTVNATNAAPVYAGTGVNGYTFPPSFATGDFNGDGVTDLAVGGADLAAGNATLKIYLASANGSLPPSTSLPVLMANNTSFSGTDAVVAGKFRPAQAGKTLYDLAVFAQGQIAIFTSNGDGTFATGATYSLSADPNYPGFSYNPGGGHPFAPVLTAADVNGDGFDDLILTLPEDNCAASGSASQGAVYILLSKSDGTFQPPVFVAPPVVNPVSVTAAKFFGSSLPDLAFADGGELCGGNAAATTGTSVGILQNKVASGATSVSASDFTPAAVLTQGSDLGVPDGTAVASADLNGDAKPDLLVSGTGGIQVLLNQGGGIFAATAQGVVPLYPGDAVPGPLCNTAGNWLGCVTYDSQLATGSFLASGESDIAAGVAGVVYLFQNQNNSGTLVLSTTQGFVAGADSTMLSGALAASNGLNSILVATSQGAVELGNSSAAPGPSFATYSSAGPIAFTTNVNTPVTQQLTLTNTGGTAFTISGISTAGLSSAFSITNIVCNGAAEFPFSTPVNLGASQSCTITLQFAPTTAGSGQADQFTILDTASASNAAANAQNNGQVIQLSGTATAPFASFSPAALNFGSVNDGTAVTQTETLTNTGTGPLVIQLIAFPLTFNGNGFSFTQILCNGAAAQFPLTLSSNQSCVVTVQFDPTVAGSLSDSLQFFDNAGPGESNLTSTASAPYYLQALPLSGTGVAPPPPPPVTLSDNETITVNDSYALPDIVDAETIQVMDTEKIQAGRIALQVTANNATRAYGAPDPGFTGSVAGAQNGDSFTENFTSNDTLTSPPGSYTIVPSVTGANSISTADLVFYSVVPTNGKLTVTQAGTSVQLSSSASGTVADGTPVVLTAKVISSTSGTPTGNVTFLDGSTTIGTAPLSQGVATFTTSLLPSGSDNIIAQYGGDADFTVSHSAPQTVSVNAPDYTVIANPSSLTLAAGQSGSTTINVTPQGFSGTVSFSCGSLPAYITCNFTPSGSLTFAGGATSPQSVTLNVSVASTIAMLQRSRPFLWAMLMPMGLLGLLPLARGKRKNLRSYLMLLALCFALTGLGVGCGGGSNPNVNASPSLPPAGTQSFTVTATSASTSGSISHQVQLTITLTN